jgi:ribosomal 50S subunit-associated protein YjgA (DUF615 family)
MQGHILVKPLPAGRPEKIESGTVRGMAKLALVYGMRLLPADDVEEIGEAVIKLKNGKPLHVTMHLIEGGEAEIRAQLDQSLDAFFDFYPEI